MEERLIYLALTIGALALIFLLIRWVRPRPLYPFERRELLTSGELPFYALLKPVCDRHGWQLLIKMRLADIVAVESGTPDYMSYFNRIKAKHTDFILCDPEDLDVLAGVELDDPSHERPERIERDEFVDRVYQAAGIPLIHVWMPITESELETLLLEQIPSLTGEEAAEAVPEISPDKISLDEPAPAECPPPDPSRPEV